MFKKKLAFQLTAGLVAIVLAAMLTLGAFFIQIFRQQAFDRSEKQMLDRAHTIADIMGEAAATGGIRGMGGFMRFLNTMTEADVWVLDAQGAPMVLSGMGMGAGAMQGHMQGPETLPPEALKIFGELQAGKDAVSEGFSSVYQEAMLTVGTPITDANGQVRGMVLLHAPVTGIVETTNRAVAILLVSLAAALLVAGGLGIAYSVRFVRPLKQMNAVALAMAEGNYEARTRLGRPDELGQLGNSLDHLASELGATINLLYQEKGKLGDIIASISEGIISFDSELKPLNANAKLAEIMNGGTDYGLEAAMSDFEALELLPAFRQVQLDKRPQAVLRLYKGKHLRLAISPILDNKGDVSGVVALVQDISESERLEQLRRDFIANVSHEFRTPLTVIKGSLEALADGTVAEPEAVARYMKRLTSETRALERLVEDLMDLSRLQEEQISLRMAPVHLPALLADVVKGIRELADRKSIRISLTTEASTPTVVGDYDRLRQLFVIFLDNALKYSPEGTTITVALNKENQVTVRDQGEGIPAEALPYIWDRFYQSDRSRESTGSGLGLSIAKRLIALHGASVAVESRPGEGTAFTVRFPS